MRTANKVESYVWAARIDASGHTHDDVRGFCQWAGACYLACYETGKDGDNPHYHLWVMAQYSKTTVDRNFKSLFNCADRNFAIASEGKAQSYTEEKSALYLLKGDGKGEDGRYKSPVIVAAQGLRFTPEYIKEMSCKYWTDREKHTAVLKKMKREHAESIEQQIREKVDQMEKVTEKAVVAAICEVYLKNNKNFYEAHMLAMARKFMYQRSKAYRMRYQQDMVRKLKAYGADDDGEKLFKEEEGIEDGSY